VVVSDNFRRANLSQVNLNEANIQGVTPLGATTVDVLSDDATVCANAALDPCTTSGLRGG
jgi:hypothetical protein